MKLPNNVDSVTLSHDGYDVPYPPLGFHSIAEHQLGNGDTFGLYWPIGREDSNPIVAETYHDEWSIQPHFSSMERFLAAAQGDDFDEDDFPETPSVDQDPESPAACFLAARNELKLQNVDAAIGHLKTATSILPEFTEAQALLCTQYRRIGDTDAAIKAAVQSIISPSCFGSRPVQIAKWLASQSICPREFESDPIWINRERLNLKFGGVKENKQFKILRGAIDDYLGSSNYVSAMTLMQTYAELMYSETVSFQERHNFNAAEFVAWQKDVARSEYGHARNL